MARVRERVDAVGGRGDPGDEHGGEEEDGALGVGPRRVVGLPCGAPAELVGVVGTGRGGGEGVAAAADFVAVGGGGPGGDLRVDGVVGNVGLDGQLEVIALGLVALMGRDGD